MRLPDDQFAGSKTILDVGGWLQPEPRATHVVDMMPWETRAVKLNLERLPNEMFSKETWHQADFSRPDFTLPFGDKSFDLVICGHTIEDLVAPRKLLDEISRVGIRGVVECPSRLAEQTLGVRDRKSTKPGHPHHHWIVESSAVDLLLYSKAASELSDADRLVPLKFMAARLAEHPAANIVLHHWINRLTYRFIAGPESRQRAQQFVEGLTITSSMRLEDRFERLFRRVRDGLRGRSTEDFSWWRRIVELSRPYSRIELS